MKSVLDLTIRKVARKLGVNYPLALMVYRSYWKYIHDTASTASLEEGVGFNIPYIGKLYTNKEKIDNYKKKKDYYDKHVKDKESKAVVLPSDCD